MRYVKVALALLAAAAGVARAGRPLTIDDAEPVAHRQFELEAGVHYTDDGASDHYDVPLGLTYGLVPRLEVGVGFGGQWEEQEDAFGVNDTASSIGDLFAGAKMKLFDQDRAWADHALAWAIKFPTADRDEGIGSGEVDFSLGWIATRRVTERMAVHANIVVTITGDSDEESFSDDILYGMAVDYQLTDTLQPVLELYAASPLDDGSETVLIINGGMRWQAVESLVLDGAVGFGLTDESPDVHATLGLTWTF